MVQWLAWLLLDPEVVSSNPAFNVPSNFCFSIFVQCQFSQEKEINFSLALNNMVKKASEKKSTKLPSNLIRKGDPVLRASGF